MQTERENKKGWLVLLPLVEELVPLDHHFGRLNWVLNLSVMLEPVRNRYCQDNGRPLSAYIGQLMPTACQPQGCWACY